VPAVITAQAVQLLPGSASHDELDKRARTIEDLLTRLLRLFVLAGILTLVLAVLDLWAVLAVIVVVLVAVVFATQDVVLDYVMGMLILVEGPFFKGDYVVVPGHPGVEGVVEEVGLRRTVLRDPMGVAHAVSNGYIRLSSNRTRLYSIAVGDVVVLHAADLRRRRPSRRGCGPTSPGRTACRRTRRSTCP
jgi:small-conductance mechanosensitive channel